MKIMLVNIDSKLPNIALKKIEIYHKQRGDEIVERHLLSAMFMGRVYVSCIFGWNKGQCKEWEGFSDIGGSGYDLYKQLPEEIEQIKPRINYGFTTRGCIRKCEFCVVPQKEGRIRVVGDLYDIWDGKSRSVVFLDNNILGLKEQFHKVCQQAQKESVAIQFNQGLDIRLLTPKIAQELKKTKLSELWFAWDNPNDEDIIVGGIHILKAAGIKNFRFYVLVGFNTTFEQDLYRFNRLKEITIKEELNIRPYCMRYETCKGKKEYIKLARWVNMPWAYIKTNYEEFV